MNNPTLDDISLSQELRNDDLCSRFESEFLAGREPKIEALLACAPSADQPALLRELLRLECELFVSRGTTVSLETYQERFPEYTVMIQEVIGAVHAGKQSALDSPVAPAAPMFSETLVSIQTSRDGHAETPRFNAKTETPPPRQFGRYAIEKELGRGAMGVVYLATDTQLGRKVALKIPTKSILEQPDALERFYREARTSGTLRHPNICPVYDVGAIDGVHFLTMAYIPGQPVSNFLKKGKLPPARQVALLIRKIAQGLDQAHANGIVHRDLKPSNVMLDTRGEPVVMDFGLACQMNTIENARLTHSGAILGTPAYMAPEQVNGDLGQIGPCSDIYALGVMFYQFLTGELPFSGTVLKVFAHIITEQPKRPSELRRDVDPTLESICLKMMAKDIAQRYASMKDVVVALTEYLKTGTVHGLEPASTIKTAATVSDSVKPEFGNLSVFPGSSKQTRSQPSGQKRAWISRKSGWYWPGIGVATGIPLTLLLAVVIVLRNGGMTVEVTIDDPTAVVKVDGKTLSINGEGVGETKLTLGEHNFTVKRGNETIRGPESFTVTKNGRNLVSITLKKPQPVAPPINPPPLAVAPFKEDKAKELQAAWANHLGVPVEYKNSIGMKFVLIPPGEFMMGSTPAEIEAALKHIPPDDKHWQDCIKFEAPQHKVILTQPTYLGANEVTQAEYEKVMGHNPSHFATLGMGKDAVAGMVTTDHPVEMVSWNDAAEFCAKLSQQEKFKPFYFRAGETVTPLDGTGYRLPTEAEWEFACRAGTATKCWIGDNDDDFLRAGFGGNSGGRTHAVGELKGNPFGLYDIHGNVCEWVQDSWELTYYGEFQEKAAINPNGPSLASSGRVFRGGAWHSSASGCRSSARLVGGQSSPIKIIGFRVLLTLDAVKSAIANQSSTVAFAKTSWHGWPADAPPPAIAPFDAAHANQHQGAWAKYLKVPVEHTNSIGMKFRLIPPGEFMMGSTPAEIEAALKETAPDDKYWQSLGKSEGPQHKVILTQPTYLGVNEITQAEYEKVMGHNPSHFAPLGMGKDAVAGMVTTEQPVEMVSWNHAAEFCAKLSQLEKFKPFYLRTGETITPLDGTGYRLPSEAEWEFACRAGTVTKYWIGDTDEDLMRAAWCNSNAEGRTHAAGQLKANPFGLHDIHGNVWEWVQDGWDATFYGQFGEEPGINPNRPFSADSGRVLRGGDWPGRASHCRSSRRVANDPSFRDSNDGFRVSLTLDAVKAAIAAEKKSPAKQTTAWKDWPKDAPPPAIAPFNAEQAKQHQEAWAKYLKVSVEYINSIGMKFRLIPPGEFMMGSASQEIESILLIPEARKNLQWQALIRSEAPRHKVVLTQPIYVGVYEVTQGQYEKVMRNNPAHFAPQGGGKNDVAGIDTTRHPVETVSWNNAVEFCTKLSQQEHHKPCPPQDATRTTSPDDTGYRLLTEAEWEFACRAGATTKYWTGEKEEGLRQAGWFNANGGRRTHAVGELNPNPFGLYDVHGNVWEWVRDGWESPYYASFGNLPAVNPICSTTESLRVFRGGHWFDPIAYCRASNRDTREQAEGFHYIGFRASLSIAAVKRALAAPPVAFAPFTTDKAKAHQAAWAKYLGVPVEYINSIGMQFVLIPPGEFMMGCTPAEIELALTIAGDNKLWHAGIQSETPRHNVILTRPIYLGATEVTQAQYMKVMGANPSHFAPTGAGKSDVANLDTATHPVEMVSWHDAIEFCSKLNRLEKLKSFQGPMGKKTIRVDGTEYRLPTEAEWEFGCRAGTTTKYWTGDQDSDLAPAGWTAANAFGRPQEVRRVKPNPFGLYDMHGNVWEWVQDAWDPNYYRQFSDQPAIDPLGPAANSLGLDVAAPNRIFRGGDWSNSPSASRSSLRHSGSASARFYFQGFRVALVIGGPRVGRP